MRILSPALCGLAALTLPAPAFAYQFAQAAGQVEDIEKRARAQRAAAAADANGNGTPGSEQTVQLAAELATALSRGNTETFHVSGSVRLGWAFADRWVSETRARALYEESYGTNTANNWGLQERVDRFLTARLSAFGAAGIERDIFAGIDYRYSGQLGAAFLVIDNKDPVREVQVDRFQVELGGYGARENYLIPPNAPPDTVLEESFRNIYAGRAAASYVHGFEKGTNAGVELEVIQDFNDTENFVLNDSVFVAAAVVEGLALKVALTHRYDAQPASEELDENDMLLTAGIVVSL